MSATVEDGEAFASSQLQLCRTCSRVPSASVLLETDAYIRDFIVRSLGYGAAVGL